MKIMKSMKMFIIEQSDNWPLVLETKGPLEKHFEIVGLSWLLVVVPYISTSPFNLFQFSCKLKN